MKVLLVGGGGREHALAWRLRRDDPSITIIAAPGNPGIASLATCVAVSTTDIDGLLALAKREAVDFTIVGPEAPLEAGIVDRFRADGLAIFGPTANAARIETSKAFAKGLMADAGVPTAAAAICTSIDEADAAIAQFGVPVVIKASGLAAGKGVSICGTVADAHDAALAMLSGSSFGESGETVVIEEFMTGEELSLFVVTDGANAIPLVAAQDHKRLLDGDQGPNTGGMGAYAPVSLAPDPLESPVIEQIMMEIVDPTLGALANKGCPFTGLLYVGAMLTPFGPKVVEFNCRFGDPETEAVLPVLRMTPSLTECMRLVATGSTLPGEIDVSADGCAVTTVVAAAGYPDKPMMGAAVTLPTAPDNVIVFHAGTKTAANGSLVVSGGRVLAITAVADSVAEAAEASRAFAGRVQFEGKQFRGDIGWRELARTTR